MQKVILTVLLISTGQAFADSCRRGVNDALDKLERAENSLRGTYARTYEVRDLINRARKDLRACRRGEEKTKIVDTYNAFSKVPYDKCNDSNETLIRIIGEEAVQYCFDRGLKDCEPYGTPVFSPTGSTDICGVRGRAIGYYQEED